MAGPACETCKFFAPLDEREGQCRRNAPHALTPRPGEDAHFRASWPRVDKHDWCGEHAAAGPTDNI